MDTKKHTKKCMYCQSTFETSRDDTVWCSANCKAAYARVYGYYRGRYHEQKFEEHIKDCEQCGKAFTFNDYALRGGQRVPKYCSSTCRKRANRAKGKDAPHTDARDDRYTKGTGQSKEASGKRAHYNKGTGQDKQGKGTGQTPPPRDNRSRTSNDPYEILGVSRTSKYNDIKSAWRTLMRKYHPDVCKDSDATERCQHINSAWDKIRKEHGWKS